MKKPTSFLCKLQQTKVSVGTFRIFLEKRVYPLRAMCFLFCKFVLSKNSLQLVYSFTEKKKAKNHMHLRLYPT